MKNSYILSESELVKLIKKILSEQNENPVDKLADCLSSKFQIQDKSKLPFCIKMHGGDLSNETLMKCGNEICEVTKCEPELAIDKLEELTECLTGTQIAEQEEPPIEKKNPDPEPKPPTTKELIRAAIKAVKGGLEKKNVQFKNVDGDNLFVGYVRNVSSPEVGVFKLDVQKILPGQIGNETEKQVREYIFDCKNPSSFKLKNLVRNLTNDEVEVTNAGVIKIINDNFCSKKFDKPVNVDIVESKKRKKSVILEQPSETKKYPRLYGPKSPEQFENLRAQFCNSDGQTVGGPKLNAVAANTNLTVEEAEKIQKSCPESPIAKIPNFGLSPEELFENAFSRHWDMFVWSDETKSYHWRNRPDWTWEEEINKYGITKETAEKFSQKYPDAELSKIFVSGNYEGASSPTTTDNKSVATDNKSAAVNDDQTAQEEKEVIVKDSQTSDDGLSVLIGKTAGFYDDRNKFITYARLVDVYDEQNDNKNIVFIELEPIDKFGNLTKMTWGNFVVDTDESLIIALDCNGSKSYLDEGPEGRKYPANSFVLNNPELSRNIKKNYCSRFKKIDTDFTSGQFIRR